MSQIFKGSSGSNPPTVATSYETDNGTAVPAANILIVHATDSTENNNNGIVTKGGSPNTAASNEVDIVLTNRVTGQITTNNIGPTDIVTFNLGSTPGVYMFQAAVSAFNVTDTEGAAYAFTASARTTGAAAFEVGSEVRDIFEEGGMTSANCTFSVSGNTILVSGTGLAGKTIHWDCLIDYRFVG